MEQCILIFTGQSKFLSFFSAKASSKLYYLYYIMCILNISVSPL